VHAYPHTYRVCCRAAKGSRPHATASSCRGRMQRCWRSCGSGRRTAGPPPLHPHPHRRRHHSSIVGRMMKEAATSTVGPGAAAGSEPVGRGDCFAAAAADGKSARRRLCGEGMRWGEPGLWVDDGYVRVSFWWKPRHPRHATHIRTHEARTLSSVSSARMKWSWPARPSSRKKSSCVCVCIQR
jgi:hypothetical protein